MGCRSDPSQHALSVLLPRAISPEMVTISANKGDRLRVVAQAWMGQDECEFFFLLFCPLSSNSTTDSFQFVYSAL